MKPMILIMFSLLVLACEPAKVPDAPVAPDAGAAVAVDAATPPADAAKVDAKAKPE